MKRSAILLGATGLTGSHLLKLLVSDDNYDEVIVLTRQPLTYNHPKIREYVVDLLKLEQYDNLFKGSVVFCCIGTTKKKTPDKSTYRAIDFGIPVNAAMLSKRNEIPFFIAISAMGANHKSKLFYNRVKGEMESEVLKQKIKHTHLLRPSLITGRRHEKRFMEDVSIRIMKNLNFFIPSRYRAIKAETIAKAMIQLSLEQVEKQIILSDEIKQIAQRYEKET